MKNSKILIILEKTSFRNELIQKLLLNKYEAILANDIIEAIQLTRKNSFKSIIAQFEIKGSDAIELILNVKDFTEKIPNIIIDFKNSKMEHETLKAGATRYFSYPVSIETIYELLKGINDKKIWRVHSIHERFRVNRPFPEMPAPQQ